MYDFRPRDESVYFRVREEACRALFLFCTLVFLKLCSTPAAATLELVVVIVIIWRQLRVYERLC